MTQGRRRCRLLIGKAGQKPQGVARYGVASMPPTPSAGALSDLRFSHGPSRTPFQNYSEIHMRF